MKNTQAKKIQIRVFQLPNGNKILGRNLNEYFVQTTDGVLVYSYDEMVEIHKSAFIEIADQF